LPTCMAARAQIKCKSIPPPGKSPGAQQETNSPDR